MELQEIEVVIGPDGTARVEVHGVSGPACLELTEQLEAALGGEVVSRELRPEAEAGRRVDTAEHLHRG